MKLTVGLVLLATTCSGLALADTFNNDFGAYNGFKNSGLSTSCIDSILNAVERRCNHDSLAAEGKDRMNPCQDFESDVATSGQHNGKIEVGGAAGDADEYWYAITIHDAARCKVTIQAEQ